ncbi:MAG TPA: energy-coupling factor transporter transmembrane protein EcfT, partial [Synergistaceae bacterium]|nr:energy-coupling factor transporter transmembrane protein EcfT [Synergistaceae bacterium]
MKFLDHMTLGQYIPVDSLVHRLDPRCKILGTVALMGALFVGDGAGAMGAWGGLFFLLASASKIPVSMALRGVRPVVILIAFTAVINLFFSSGEPLWSWGILRVSR